MDAAYIKTTVSAAVIEGLSALARVCPDDPVDFLGQWLIKHGEVLQQQQVSNIQLRDRNFDGIVMNVAICRK